MTGPVKSMKSTIWQPFAKRFGKIESTLAGIAADVDEIKRNQASINESLKSIEHLLVLNDVSNEEIADYIRSVKRDD